MRRRRGVLHKRAGNQRAQGQAQGWEGTRHDGRLLTAVWLQVDQRGADRSAGQGGCDALQGSGPYSAPTSCAIRKTRHAAALKTNDAMITGSRPR